MLRVQRILAPNPGVFTLEGTNTWIVGDGPTLVIDPAPALAEHLDEVRPAAGNVAHVLVTHDHEDHAEGAAAFAASVVAPVSAWRLDGADRIKDEQTFSVPGAEVVALHAPGHSADSVVFLETASRGMFTGDTVLGRGTSFIDPPDGDLAKYLGSLRRLSDLEPRTLYPGHGPLVLDGSAKLREYLDHRAEREEQVLAALGEPRTVAQLVEEIYPDQPAEVRPLAARTMTAQLRKLDAEGRVEKRGRGGQQTWRLAEARTCARCGRAITGRARYCGPCSLALLQGADPAPTRADGS